MPHLLHACRPPRPKKFESARNRAMEEETTAAQFTTSRLASEGAAAPTHRRGGIEWRWRCGSRSQTRGNARDLPRRSCCSDSRVFTVDISGRSGSYVSLIHHLPEWFISQTLRQSPLGAPPAVGVAVELEAASWTRCKPRWTAK
eukprot:725982-Prymnesium_polylepis.4